MKNVFVIILFIYATDTSASLDLKGKTRSTFDHDLYESVLDSELCAQQTTYLMQNNSLLLMTFLDASARIPRGILTGISTDYGNYHQCLSIKEEVLNKEIGGKYCLINVPFPQNINRPWDVKVNNLEYQMKLLGFGSSSRYLDSSENSPVLRFNLGVCIPKSCTSHEWVHNVLFNGTGLAFEFQEEYCRLPKDKPLVAADYVAMVIFVTLILLTVLSTSYELYYMHFLKRDLNEVNQNFHMFSVYTNTIRLTSFKSNANNLDCLDGIRSISMMWVIICHTYSSFAMNINIRDLYQWLISAQGIWIVTGFFAVDTFFTMAGILLVYSSMGKLNGAQLLKKLHLFYINRLLRMYPLLAAVVLLEASLFHQIGDGPNWVAVAINVERCRHFWWSTLLFVQNYVSPTDMCLFHTWYLAVDIQLFILSPLILFWVLGESRRSALIAVCSAILVVMTAATIFIYVYNLPPGFFIADNVESLNYIRLYYFNTLTRAAPFFIGMAFGYVLFMLKGRRLLINTGIMLLSWVLSLCIIALAFYTSYKILQEEWNGQVYNSPFNSFMRAGWAVALGWIIIACVKGHGGIFNWFLSLSIWKILSRISYAMYLFHYPIQNIVTGMVVTPSYFSAGRKAFEFLAIFTLTFIVAFVVTIVIDAPFTILIKLILQREGNQKSERNRSTKTGIEKTFNNNTNNNRISTNL